MAKKRYICKTEIKTERGTRDIATKSLRAKSLDKAREKYNIWLLDNLPVWAKDAIVVKQHIDLASEFEIEIKKVKDLRWWEEDAIRYAKLCSKDPGEFDTGLESLATSIDDSWSEAMHRDGEPGPKAGTVYFEANEENTRLVIRSNRILAIITIKTEL